jgi:TPR repeat protein
MLHFYNETGEGDLGEAYAWFSRAAEAADPLAYYYLGSMHERGDYAEQDTALARVHFTRAAPGLRSLAEAGDPDAMANLGLMFNVGTGVESHPESALSWVRQAAEAGLVRAQYYTGFYYFHGVGTAKDRRLAVEWLEEAAAGGHSSAQAMLGNAHYNGWVGEADADGAKAWFEKAETYPAASERFEGKIYYYNGIPFGGDEILPGLLPPRSRLQIKEGDCGEACLWTLLRAWGIETTEIDINEIAGEPGRGLHAYELSRVLDHHDLDYRDTMGHHPISYVPGFFRKICGDLLKRSPDVEMYQRFIRVEIIGSLRRGIPVLLAVKVFPSQNPLYPCDHFILVVGYNEETEELIYNSHNRRERVKISKLLDTSDGYSLINGHATAMALWVPVPKGERR